MIARAEADPAAVVQPDRARNRAVQPRRLEIEAQVAILHLGLPVEDLLGNLVELRRYRRRIDQPFLPDEMIAGGRQFGRHRVALRPRRFLDQLARSAEHTSELQSLMRSSYAVFCLNTTNTEAQIFF